MNNLLGESVLTKIKTSAGLLQVFYGSLLVASIFFIAGTCFTILTTIRLLATVNPLPSSLLLFTTVYILIQASLAYGFFTAQRWVAYALISHTAIIALTAFVLLPLFDASSLTKRTLLGGIPIALLAAMTYLNRSHLTNTKLVLPTLLYTLLIAISLTLSVIIYVYKPA